MVFFEQSCRSVLDPHGHRCRAHPHRWSGQKNHIIGAVLKAAGDQCGGQSAFAASAFRRKQDAIIFFCRCGGVHPDEMIAALIG
jgi:hypothetical protein